MSNEIPDWKKVNIIALSNKYGHRAISNRLDISKTTAKRYRDLAQEDGYIETSGNNIQIKDEN